MGRYEVELGPVGMCRMDDRRPLAQAAPPREELDRPAAVLGKALLDLFRLLVRVNVQRQPICGGVAPDLLEPLGRAGADGVGGEPDADAGGAQGLDLLEVLPHRLLAEAVEAAACVGDVQHNELDSGRSGGSGGRMRFRNPDIVKLADRRVPGGDHLLVALLVGFADEIGRLALSFGEHHVAPGPEVAAGRASA